MRRPVCGASRELGRPYGGRPIGSTQASCGGRGDVSDRKGLSRPQQGEDDGPNEITAVEEEADSEEEARQEIRQEEARQEEARQKEARQAEAHQAEAQADEGDGR